MDIELRYSRHGVVKMPQLCEKSRNKTAQMCGYATVPTVAHLLDKRVH